MRYLLLKALFVLLLLVPPAAARITLLPSDDTAGGGAGDIYWFMNFGSTNAAWPTVDECLSSTGGGNGHRDCAATDTPDSRRVTPYFGQVFVRYLACAPAGDHSLWLSASVELALHEVQGSDVESNFVRKQIGGTLTFDETDGVGVSKRLTINAPTTLENGSLQMKFVVVSAAPVSTSNDFSCTVALIE